MGTALLLAAGFGCEHDAKANKATVIRQMIVLLRSLRVLMLYFIWYVYSKLKYFYNAVLHISKNNTILHTEEIRNEINIVTYRYD